MSDLVEKRKIEFEKTVLEMGNLPKIFEKIFEDGSDQRLWFDGAIKVEKFRDYVAKIDEILSRNGIKRLNDKEREVEFINLIQEIDRIPLEREYYFSDNIDMKSWHNDYVNRNRYFANKIKNIISESINFELAEIWPDSEKELTFIIKKLGRIPNYHETYLQNGIDARILYDELSTFEPSFVEKAKLFISNLKNNDYDNRKVIFLNTVRELGYIPFLQECRFSDGIDMFTWYMKYKDLVENLEDELNSLIKPSDKYKKVNIYLIPNFKNTGGKFYTICTNIGEKLDLSSIVSDDINKTLEEVQKIDSSFKKSGGIILKRDEEIDSVNFTNIGKGRK